MSGPNESKAAADDHESDSKDSAAPSKDHELWTGAQDTALDQPDFADDAPGDGYSLPETLPGLAIDLNSDVSDSRSGIVGDPFLDAAPWSWIVRVTAIYQDGSEAAYTGWLASERVVVTSGRCLFDPSRGAAIKVKVGASPARNAAGLRWIESTEFKRVKGWVRDTKRECDYGAVILPAPGLKGIGFFGRARMPGSRPTGEWLNVSGYPENQPALEQYYESFRVAEVSEDFLIREDGFHGAAAGSPLWLYMVRNNRAQRFVCGMVGSNVDRGEALRLNRDIYKNFQDWIKEAEEPPAKEQSGGAKPAPANQVIAVAPQGGST
jgi:V8-like Glu-specific endopeptidase